MKALSVRQPWAWLIVNGHKDIENRTWQTNYRGSLLILAAKQRANPNDFAWARRLCRKHQIQLPERYDYGGIVGRVTLVDCVEDRPSDWFEGPYGFVLADAVPTEFRPYRGALGLFNVPEDVIPANLLT